MYLSPAEQLMYSTVRIECSNNKSSSIGTGFNFTFKTVDGRECPVILTNKHVVDSMTQAKIVFCLRDQDGKPLDKNHYNLTIANLHKSVINHPDPNVDLCAIPTGGFEEFFKKDNFKIFTVYFDEQLIPSQQQLQDLNPVEKILMVGYPIGLWDSVNNKPIFRNGYTATHPAMDYCGKREFLIDAACFPGSSGSPVLLFEPSNHTPKNGNLMAAPRIFLLGILYAGPQYSASGEIQIIDVPTVQKPVSSTQLMLNLGYVIKSDRIIELRNVLGI